MPIFYPIIIALGIVSSYTDIKFRKIRNAHLAIAAACALAAYVYLMLNGKFALNAGIMTNVLVSLACGFLLYFNGTWGAGDAKLFTVFCLLMPTRKYSALFPLPSIAIFINIFILSTLFILFSSLLGVIRGGSTGLLKKLSYELLPGLFKSFVIVLAAGWTMTPLIKFLPAGLGPFAFAMLLYFAYALLFIVLDRYKNKYVLPALLVAGFLSRFVLQASSLSFQGLALSMKNTIIYTLAFSMLSIIFDINKRGKISERTMPFAPFIFLGTVAADTGFIYWIMRLMSSR